MKKFRSAVLAPALAAFFAMALTACGQSESPQSTGEDTGQAANQLLAYVPADTPYVAANLEPVLDCSAESCTAAQALRLVAVPSWSGWRQGWIADWSGW